MVVKNPICEEGGETGIFLPLSEQEHSLGDAVRVLIYGFCLIYCFLGVSIAADIFMGAIEAITVRRVQRRDRATGKVTTSMVWNETVANLSLMALGSSAPEIFLSVIDMFRAGFYDSDLGPSTIVGSAAFNLFVIVAVCMVAIPSGQGRAVEQVGVFGVTAFFSLLAYIWVMIIVEYSSPNQVTVLEALLTFAFLPLLIWVSWRVDVYGLQGLMPGAARREGADGRAESPAVEEIVSMGRRTSVPRIGRVSCAVDSGRGGNIDMKHELIKTVIAGRGKTRVNRPTGSGISTASSRPPSGLSEVRTSRRSGTSERGHVQFLVDHQHMSSELEQKPIWLVRHGSLLEEIRVEYSVEALTSPLDVLTSVRTAPEAVEQWAPILTSEEAKARSKTPTAQVPVKGPQGSICVKTGEVLFASGEDQKQLVVARPLSQDFELRVHKASSSSVTVGPIRLTQVKTVEANSRGKLRFACGQISVKSSEQILTAIEVVVVRTGGCSGTVSCNYRTEPLSALADCHFESVSGQLDFADGVTEASFDVQILPISGRRCPKDFIVVLDDPDSLDQAEFEEEEDGGSVAAILTVHIETPPGPGFWRRMDSYLNLDALHLGNADWHDHARSTLFVGGSLAAQREAGWFDWSMHILALPWKVFFVLAPSIHYFGGWLCFCVSLVYIAFLTGVIADLADLFGCVLGISDMITAITFVAIGTSMPDLFASKGAAQEDPTADASIVNVTGSNSVNVFLGLGLPWTIGALYWEFASEEMVAEWVSRHGFTPEEVESYGGTSSFIVKGEDLAVNVLAFSVCCVISLIMLVLKRRIVGAELGGPSGVKYSIAILFVILWFAYITLASFNVLQNTQLKDAKSSEPIVYAVVFGIIGLCVAIALTFLALFRLKSPRDATPEEPSRDTATIEPEKPTEPGGEDAATEENHGGEIKPPLVAMEPPSGSRGRCFAKS